MLSALLLAGGCARASKPKAFVLPRCHARIVCAEEQFDAVLNFAAKPQKVILKTQQNAFDTLYLFEKDSVILRYDNIQTQLNINALPDTNIATLLYKLINAVQAGEGKWERTQTGFSFCGKVNGTAFSAKCDGSCQLLECEVPEYQFYCKTVN